ncbi:DUF3455 domain-containing protein [Sorangium atrum]|uniref:DUF3455 domain-containing protein n=1 Tax=Sorangium atrum TaxID=2995308 RepID=A0ABT5CEP3_9BACT|nr:DUF3455 domain-containing protein [Sorangium aterium]MDC0684904.1 DUF3455 domain-containing protein [Sorangium aterium]
MRWDGHYEEIDFRIAFGFPDPRAAAIREEFIMNARYAIGFIFIGFGCAGSTPSPSSPPPSEPPASAEAPAPVAPPPSAPAPVQATPATEPAAPASVPKLAPPETPDAIKAPSTANLVLKANAKGAQIYVCGKKKEPKAKFEWTLKAPDATLSDEAGKTLGKHYGGPTWEAADGSKVVGAMKAKVDAPDATAIPWLLLEIKSTEGQGVLSHVAWIQRVQTVGGKAPADGCDKAHDGAEARVDYSAAYYFYANP